MADRPACNGTKTARYQVVRGYFYPLVLTFEPELPKLASKLFEKELISTTDLENASNSSLPEFDRSLALLRRVLAKIEYDQRNFEVFTSILHEFSGIASELESSLKKEIASTAAKRVHLHPYSVRRYSDGILATVRRHLLAFPEEKSNLLEDICISLHQGEYEHSVKKTVDQLEADKESCARKLKNQGVLINRKDDEIKELEHKYAEKKKVVADLKAEKEKRIHDLQAQCAAANKEIQSAHKIYQDHIAQLQKDLEAVRLSEQKAKDDLAKAEAKLWKARLSKEKELSKLREEYNKLKEIKNELQFQHRISHEERKVESAMKDKMIAEEARQHAETKTILARREKELAELKAQEERKKLELKVQELQEKLKLHPMTA